MQYFPSVTNCGHCLAIGIEGIRLPESFLSLRPAHSPRTSQLVSTAIIEQHLAEFFRVASVADVAAYCMMVPGLDSTTTVRTVSLERSLFDSLERVATFSDLPVRTVIEMLRATAARELCA